MAAKEKVTIYDISAKLKVSAATVSRALNGMPGISSKTRELVVKTARKMNYKQNGLALALQSGKTKKVGVVVPYIDHSFFSAAIRGIEEELSLHGYSVIICQSHESLENEKKQLDSLLDSQVDGIFISISKATQHIDHIKKVLQNNIPLIFFDRKIKSSDTNFVVLDDFKAGYMVTEHLIRQGAQHIAHLYGDLNLDIYRKRYEGYLAALRSYDLPCNPKHVIPIDAQTDSGIQAVSQLWKHHKKPDAIFSASDHAALGAIMALKKRKVKVPEEVSVAGFGNHSFTKFLDLPITTIDQTPQRAGRTAAQIFLNETNVAQHWRLPKRVVLTPELIIRKSSVRNHFNLMDSKAG